MAAGTAALTYTVRKGDTLTKVARRFGVTVEALLAANPQITNPNRIKVGQVLTIPSPAPTPEPEPTPTPEPPPPPPAGRFLMGMTEADIGALPMSGAGWNNVVAQSDKTITVDLSPSGISSTAAARAFCAALRYVRTGTTSYRDKVVTALEQVRAVDPASGGYYSTYERQMTGFVLAADLVGHRTQAWTDFVDTIRFATLPGHSAWGGLFVSSHRSANNHGQLARSSLLACNLFLGDRNTLTPTGNPGGVEQDVRYMRCFLGEPTHYGTYAGASPTSGTWGKFYPGSLGWTDGSTWMDNPVQDVWAPINPGGGPTKEGALNQEVHRDGARYALSGGRPVFGSGGAMYSYTAGMGVLAVAALLAANGSPQVWSWSDQAVRRWREYLARWGYGHTHPNYSGWIDPLLNHIYGTTYTAVDAEGYGLTATRWLAQHPDWLTV